MRTFQGTQHHVIGMDRNPSDFTDHVGSIENRAFVAQHMPGVDVVIHTATLHKPHIATHSRQEFLDTNVTGTLNLLEESIRSEVKAFVFTSTTSTFGDALIPEKPEAPSVWVTEKLTPIPKNIYGATKIAAEDLCQLFHRNHGLPCLILRTSRFFPEADDRKNIRGAYQDENLKLNEFLHRRVDIEDVVTAHLLAMNKASEIGFGRYIISATTPFSPADLSELRRDAPSVLRRAVPEHEQLFADLGWQMFPTIDRVYVNDLARQQLGWEPEHDFRAVLSRVQTGKHPLSPLASLIGRKMYHSETFDDKPYPVE